MIKVISKLLEDGWNVAYRQLPEGEILGDTNTPFYIIPNTWRTWEADPFVFQYDGKIYIFAEMFDYITRRGSIGYTQWEKNRFTPWKKVICESFHMSYPNVFLWHNEIYMLPETSESRKLLLYKAIRFPEQWECIRVLAEDVMWVDTTFFRNNDILYAITTDVSDEENQKDYLLTFSDNLDITKKEQIRECNIKYSRSGGRFFTYDGKMIRVTQDCSERYGEAIIFSELFPEKVLHMGVTNILCHLFPQELKMTEKKTWIGLHTYNATEQFEVIDIERQHFNIFGLFRRVLGKVFK